MNTLNENTSNSKPGMDSQIDKLSKKINILINAIFNQSENGLLLLDFERVILMANHSASEILSNDVLVGQNFISLFDDTAASELNSAFKQIQLSGMVENESSTTLKVNYSSADKKHVAIALDLTALYIDEELFFIVRFKDIGREKRYEAEISLMAHAMMSINEGLTIIDLDGKIIFANEAFYKIFAYPLNSLNSKNLLDLCDKESAQTFRENVLSQPTRCTWQGELTCMQYTGLEFPYSVSTSPILDEKNQPFLVICVGRDISDEKNLEYQLQHSSKLEALGQLAGGVAHDFNNLLIVIHGHADKIMHQLTDDSLRNSANEIIKASRRATGLTRQLLAYSRKQVLTPQVFDINDLIHDLYKMLSSLIGENIKFKLDLNPTPINILADQHQFGNVIMNLCVNARDAMPDGGKLILKTSLMNQTDLHIPDVEIPDTPIAHIAVIDTGTGIPDEVRSKIFDPFFTTKPKGRGTGLGLSMVYGIIKQSNGYIDIDSTPGMGTTFHIYLPVHQEQNTQLSSANIPEQIKPEEQPDNTPDNATVLVVEDEEQVRTLVCEMLESFGYNVLHALNGLEAIDIYKDHGENIDLILTDMVMPEMGGQKLIENLPDLKKGVKVLYMSGYTDTAIDEQGLPDSVEFIQKPFSPPDLLNKIAKILNKN